MARDVTTSLEAEYEPSHDETDEPTVIHNTCHQSDEPLCM